MRSNFKAKRGIDCTGKHRLLVFCVLLSFLFIPILQANVAFASSLAVEQQKISVTGVVVDTHGEAVIGASVVIQGSTTGTITDLDGVFKMDVPPGSKLVISFMGYETQTVSAKNGQMRIVLADNTVLLNEVQVVAYGVQKKVTVTGAISGVKGDELVKTPVASVSNVLSGLVTGVSSVQTSGEPGSDNATIYIRGKATWADAAPLVQVDGVERDFNSVDPNEIESITVLKDASATAVFGVKGANGVLLITTKRGTEGKARISFSTSASIVMPTKSVGMANSYQYADFYNQMRANDGLDPVFSDAVMQKFKGHSDPIRFPDTDWVNYVLEKRTLQTQHNVNISGGTSTVRYFISASAHTQDGMFKQFGLPYDLTYQYNRYNYRANLDIDVSKSTLLSINLGGKVDNSNKPYTGQGSTGMMKNIYYATPFSSPGIVDGKLVMTTTDYQDLSLPFTGATGFAYYGNGFMETSVNTLNADVILKQNLDMLTKGLSFTVKGSYNSSFKVNKSNSASVATYYPVLQSDGTIAYKKEGENTQISYTEPTNSQGKARNWYMEAGFNYDRTFGDHHVGALVLYNQDKIYYPSTYSDIPKGTVGFVGRIYYDWKNRYMAEFNIGCNGSENFAPGKRFGTFPAGSFGWTASEESFWSPIKPYVNYLKLRASFGLVGNANVGGARFMYTADPYNVGNNTSPNRGGYGYIFGINSSTVSYGAYEASKNNPDVTWEKAFKQNYGVDFSTFDERIKGSFDYFIERRKDILLQDGTAPGVLGFATPYANLGKVKSWGWEVSLRWDDVVGKDFRYWVGANVSYNQNEILERKEAPQNYPWLYQKGHRIGTNSLYKFWRYYDEGTPELYESTFGTPFPDHGSVLQLGDAVFVDLNGDGVIDTEDTSRALGYTNDPEYIFGLNMGFSWKRFDVSLQWTGAWNVSRVISDVFRRPFVSGSSTTEGGLLIYHYKNTWTKENPSQSAAYPRATWTNATNNYRDSSLFEQDASYLRLKTVTVAYNFDLPFMKKLKMNSCVLAFSGYNILTFTDYKWGDPEATASNAPSYPLQKNYSVSLKLGF